MFAYLDEWPLTAIYLSGLLAFTLASVILYLAPFIRRQRAIFRALGVASNGILEIRLGGPYKIGLVTLETILHNIAQRSIYIKLHRFSFSMQDKTRTHIVLPERAIFVGPGEQHRMSYPSIEGLDATKPLRGLIEFEFLYGPAEDKLKYLFVYRAEPIISISDKRPKVSFRLITEVIEARHTSAP